MFRNGLASELNDCDQSIVESVNTQSNNIFLFVIRLEDCLASFGSHALASRLKKETTETPLTGVMFHKSQGIPQKFNYLTGNTPLKSEFHVGKLKESQQPNALNPIRPPPLSTLSKLMKTSYWVGQHKAIDAIDASERQTVGAGSSRWMPQN